MTYYHHDLDPIAFQIGSLVMPWYWLVYVLGFFFVYFLSEQQRRKFSLPLSKNELIDTMVFSWIGLVLGGRLFYVVAYNLAYYLDQPSEIIEIWRGGMSFHGGVLGVIAMVYLQSRRLKVPFFLFTDLFALGSSLVLGFGRLANFVNGELAGRVTDVPWAVVFSSTYDHQPRHPSQVYEAILEGLVTFLVLFSLRKRLAKGQVGFLSVTFLACYGSARFVVEFFREPDPQIGFLFEYFTMGQLLCLLMLGFALILYIRLLKQQRSY